MIIVFYQIMCYNCDNKVLEVNSVPVVNVNLVLDDATYAGVKAGALELCGLVKDMDSKKVRKHLPTVFDAAKDGAAKAIDIIREHKKGLLIVGGLLIIGGVVVGAVSYVSEKDKRKAKKHLGVSLQKYLDAAQDGKLTVEIVDKLINDLDVVSKLYKDNTVPLNLSAKQLSALFNSIYDYTLRMATANNVAIPNIPTPKRFTKNTVVDLQQYLNAQKQILNNAA